MSKCFAVASGKGGVGKSVLTANLAAILSLSGAQVIIVDADIGLRSQDALLSMENRVVYDLLDLANGDCLPDEAILKSEFFPSLRLLPAAQFARAKDLGPKQLSRILTSFRSFFDYILIDCPAGIERGLRTVLKAGIDEAVLVTTPDDISVRSAERTRQVIEEITAFRPQLVVNRLDRKLIRSKEMMSAQTIAQLLDLQLLGSVPEDPIVSRSILKHSLFIRYDCEARAAVCRVAARMQGGNVPLYEYGGKADHTFFRRFFSKSFREVTSIDDH